MLMAIEFASGGDLFFHLSHRGLCEADAKFIFKQLLNAMDYMHSQNIIYRDLKPENVFLDGFGNVKVGDFGLSKILNSLEDLSFNCCGSQGYVAPEIHGRKGYNYKVDYFALGVVLFDMLIRPEQEFSISLIDSIDSFNFSPQVKSLLSALLQLDPTERLCTKEGVNNFKWMEDCKEESPICPLKIGTCFDEEYLETPISPVQKAISLGSYFFRGFKSENSFLNPLFHL